MRVYYDAQTFLRQRAGGISRIFADLIRFFAESPEIGIEVNAPLRYSLNTHLLEACPVVRPLPRSIPRALPYGAHWLLCGMHVVAADVIHHTYYDPRFLRLGGSSAKRVVTVYDMIPERVIGTRHYTGSHLAKRKFVDAADVVVAISEATRAEVMELFDVDATKIAVIHLGVSDMFAPRQPPLPGFPSEYLVYVGGRRGYKDFPLLPEALESLDRSIRLPLVVVGPPLDRNETLMLRKRRLDFHVIPQPTERVLARVYSNAQALVQTSRAEGFGLPPLEAMKSGSLTVVARASAMPEVCGPAAAYFDPGSSESLASCLREVLTLSAAERHSRVQEGERWASRFSVGSMAHSLAALYAG